MPLKLKYGTINLLLLLIGLACYVNLCIDFFKGNVGHTPDAFFSPILQGILISLFFISLSAFVLRITRNIDFLNAGRLLQYVIRFGSVTLAVVLLPDLIDLTGFRWPAGSGIAAIHQCLVLLISVLYFLTAAFFMRRLVFIKKANKVVHVWKSLLILFSVGAIFNFYQSFTPSWALAIYYGASLALIFLLLLRLNWLALLTFRNKITAGGYLAAINLISLLLVKELISYSNETTGLIDLIQTPMFVLVVVFVLGYGAFSLLALLFNLPISNFMEMKNKEIATFLEMSRSVHNTVAKEDILSLLLKTCIENAQADAGWIMYQLKDKEELVAEEKMERKDLLRILFSLSARKEYQSLDNSYLYIPDFEEDELLRDHDLPFKSMLIFPIYSKGILQGKIILLKTYSQGYDDYDIDLIETHLSQASLSLKNADLIQDALQAERIKEDLHIGKVIQQRMLPDDFPYNDRLEIAGMSEAAEIVGGDYYDYYKLNNNQLALLIGDVSGKGTMAAFHVAKMKGIFQSLILSDLQPARFLDKANTAVGHCFDRGMFITLIYMLLDLEKRRFVYSRGGHCPVLFFQQMNQTAYYLEDEGLGLGILKNGQYKKSVKEYEIQFNPGDCMLLFTDGVVEARNPETKEEFGYERLRELIALNHSKSAEDILDEVRMNVKQFTENRATEDDISMLVVKSI